jgi:glycosyltransferase involved in cell wall biosynthesis
MFNRRDTTNPEGGGSERYGEIVAQALASAGHQVTIFTADHGAAPRDEVRGGVRFRRRGGKLGVLARGWADLALRRLGPVDVVVDTQNGVPFFSRLATRAPIVVLVHHVHREMWPVVYGPRAARLGWWVESRAAPRLYRSCAYIAVSDATKGELVRLGIDPDRIDVVHNGVEPAPAPAGGPAPRPTLVVLGRLVPHKRVEHVLTAAAELRGEFPDLHVRVVGDGWWHDRLVAHAARLGVDDLVDFTGFVSEQAKHEELSRAWVLAMPSLKEGWGLCVMEAATHGVPSVAYRAASGVAESIVDPQTGLLVDGGVAEFTEALRRLIADQALRTSLGDKARARAGTFHWEDTARAFVAVLSKVTGIPDMGDAGVAAVPLDHREGPGSPGRG